jgi:hypothetical protein
VVHVHARDENKRNSGDPKLYAEIIQRIRDKCEILIQTTNGIGVRRDPKTGQLVWPSDEERLQLLKLQPRQDLFGIATGSMDFYHPEGGYTQETPYVNSLDLLRQTILAVYSIGSTVEYEVVEASALHRLMRLAEQGVFDKNASNIWLLHGGGFGATPPLARNVIFSIDEGQRLFPNAKWCVVGTARTRSVSHRYTGPLHGLRYCSCRLRGQHLSAERQGWRTQRSIGRGNRGDRGHLRPRAGERGRGQRGIRIVATARRLKQPTKATLGGSHDQQQGFDRCGAGGNRVVGVRRIGGAACRPNAALRHLRRCMAEVGRAGGREQVYGADGAKVEYVPGIHSNFAQMIANKGQSPPSTWQNIGDTALQAARLDLVDLKFDPKFIPNLARLAPRWQPTTDWPCDLDDRGCHSLRA